MFEDIFHDDYFKKLNQQNQSDNLYAETGKGLDGTFIDPQSHRTAKDSVQNVASTTGFQRTARTTGPDAGKFIDSQGYYQEHDDIPARHDMQGNPGDTLTGSRISQLAGSGNTARTVPAAPPAGSDTAGPKPAGANAGKFIKLMGLADESDNLHAQRDENGESYGKPLTDSINHGTQQVGDTLRKQAAFGMTLNANEHLARAENPLGDLLTNYVENGLGKSGAQHEDESAYLLMNALFSNLIHRAVAQTVTTPPFSDTVNGQSKWELAQNAFSNEFLDQPRAILYSVSSMIGDAVTAMMPEGSIDRTAFDSVEKERSFYQQRIDNYEKNAMSLGRLPDWEHADKTLDNFSQYFNEMLGSKLPYAVLMLFNPITGAFSPLGLRLATNFVSSMADHNSRMRQKTGQNDYAGAVGAGTLHAAVREIPTFRNWADPAARKTWADFVTRLMTVAIDKLRQQWQRDTDENNEQDKKP